MWVPVQVRKAVSVPLRLLARHFPPGVVTPQTVSEHLFLNFVTIIIVVIVVIANH